MSSKHSQPVRGSESAMTSPMFEGRFGRMFRNLKPATFGKDEDENKANLGELGRQMSAGFDPPKDGKDDEESGIPALYTYLAQFIDHDITFDPASSLQKQNDPDALVDFRTPAFDLDNVYGRGSDDQPYMYDGGPKFLLGEPLKGGDKNARDLARNNAKPARALIGDPRNDENTIVSQLQGLFLRFHNRTVDDNSHLEFADIQRLVRYHYQYVVLNDFLPRVVHSSVLEKLKTNGHYDRGKLKFFHWKNDPFMPVEFSVAAYRMGHSMIRPGYRLNDDKKNLLPIFPVLSQGLKDGLTGFDAVEPNRGIDWGRFIDVDVRSNDDDGNRLQFAYRIDTSLVNPLADLPHSIATNPSSLAQRNLVRGWRLKLPSGQSVAHAMKVKILDDEEILIGKALDKPEGPLKNIAQIADGVFEHNCPLWTYILAEAMRNKEAAEIPVKEGGTINTPRLGPVGGRIVAEVFLGLMFGDPQSLLSLHPHWQPETGRDYRLKDFVNYALGK
jgi:hypothetical protein